jgi:hypothetical protein
MARPLAPRRLTIALAQPPRRAPAPQRFPTLTISASEFHTNDGRCVGKPPRLCRGRGALAPAGSGPCMRSKLPRCASPPTPSPH